MCGRPGRDSLAGTTGRTATNARCRESACVERLLASGIGRLPVLVRIHGPNRTAVIIHAAPLQAGRDALPEVPAEDGVWSGTGATHLICRMPHPSTNKRAYTLQAPFFGQIIVHRYAGKVICELSCPAISVWQRGHSYSARKGNKGYENHDWSASLLGLQKRFVANVSALPLDVVNDLSLRTQAGWLEINDVGPNPPAMLLQWCRRASSCVLLTESPLGTPQMICQLVQCRFYKSGGATIIGCGAARRLLELSEQGTPIPRRLLPAGILGNIPAAGKLRRNR